MKKPAKKDNRLHAAALAAAFTLMACGRAEPPAAGAGRAPEIQVAAVEGAGETDAPPTVVEHRHFAIYSAYRIMFEESQEAPPASAVGHREGVPSAVMGTTGGLPACSFETALLQD